MTNIETERVKMTQKERLVELLNKQKGYTLPIWTAPQTIEIMADALLENGVIIPPCKVGDTIYCDGKYFASHCAGEIMEFPVNVVETTVISTFRGEIDVQFDFDDFGKTVFLTKEEAEKALAERSGETDCRTSGTEVRNDGGTDCHGRSPRNDGEAEMKKERVDNG